MNRIKTFFAATAFALATSASAITPSYDGLVIIGDSLSDEGNIAALTPLRTPLPIPNIFTGGSLIPGAPYASGRFTDDHTWAHGFAASINALGGIPRLAGGGNYAFGGARTGPVNPGGLFASVPPTLLTQTATYVSEANPTPGTLFVVAGGGNDARDAHGAIAALIASNANIVSASLLPTINTVIDAAATQFATNIESSVTQLLADGAHDIVVWNVPDVGKTPETFAIGAGFATAGGAPSYAQLGTELAMAMSAELQTVVGPLPNVRIFDLFGFMQTQLASATFDNVTDACAASPTCVPSTHFFWDGIHPTSEGHARLATAMINFVTGVPEPSAYVMLLVGLVAVAWAVRARARV